MKLTDLNPRFYSAGGYGNLRDDELSPERHGVGISFDCPCGNCKYRAYLNFKNPIDGGEQIEPARPSWKRTGEDFETMTLTPSIQRNSGCKWHGFLTKGELKSV